MHLRFLAALALAVCCSAAACGGIVDPSKNTTDTFNGTINHGDPIAFFPFNSTKTGEISVKFTALAPVSTALMGVLVAQANGDGSCTGNLGLVQQNNFAQLNLPSISGQILERRYCLGVYESQTLLQPETFTVTVSHP
ncbi:MAG: hypothetical protein DMF93_10475 [Acidobacteria bacterium]|nr:MAG: hypothetical protein DMF93_10475 [Acidobacteriota bacterium]